LRDGWRRTRQPQRAVALRRKRLATIAAAGKFTIERRWTDSNGYFADLLLVAT